MYVFLYTTNFRLVKILEKYWQHAHQNIPKMHLHYYYITTTARFKKRSTPEKNKINFKKKIHVHLKRGGIHYKAHRQSKSLKNFG